MLETRNAATGWAGRSISATMSHMRRIQTPIVALILALGAGLLAAETLPPSVQLLTKAENDFMAAAATIGARQAFADRFAAMAVLLRPRPVEGLGWLKDNPPPDGKWSWTPDFVETSGGEDLGYTTGPWQLVPAGSSPLRSGDYLSIWRYHPQIGWKLLLTAATEHAAPDAGAPPHYFVDWCTAIAPHESLTVAREAINAADVDLGVQATKLGLRAALAARATDDIRVIGNGELSRVGRDAVLAASPAEPAAYEWEPVTTRVALSSELGYTIGNCTIAPAGTPKSKATAWSYVHIWRKDRKGAQRLALEFMLPIPAVRDSFH